MPNKDIEKKNRRLGLLLALLATTFMMGFAIKLVLTGG
jgi:hypothetical protein